MIRIILAYPMTDATAGDFMKYATHDVSDPRLEALVRDSGGWRIVGSEVFQSEQEKADQKAGRSQFSRTKEKGEER